MSKRKNMNGTALLATPVEKLCTAIVERHQTINRLMTEALFAAKEAGEMILELVATTGKKLPKLVKVVHTVTGTTISYRSLAIYKRVAENWGELEALAGSDLQELTLNEANKLLESPRPTKPDPTPTEAAASAETTPTGEGEGGGNDKGEGGAVAGQTNGDDAQVVLTSIVKTLEELAKADFEWSPACEALAVKAIKILKTFTKKKPRQGTRGK